MDLFNVIKSRRTIRKFLNDKKIEKEILENIIELWALYPSRMNKQPLEYIIINDSIICNKIFLNILRGIKNKDNKVFANEGYAPVAYIAILHNKTILEKWFEYDVWASAQSMMIYANSLWIWSVWLHSILRKNIIDILNIPIDIYNLDSIIWLWYPWQNSITVDLVDNNTSYYLDWELNLYVPKRNLKDIIHINLF